MAKFSPQRFAWTWKWHGVFVNVAFESGLQTDSIPVTDDHGRPDTCTLRSVVCRHHQLPRIREYRSRARERATKRQDAASTIQRSELRRRDLRFLLAGGVFQELEHVPERGEILERQIADGGNFKMFCQLAEQLRLLDAVDPQ